jgi:plastocyanin
MRLLAGLATVLLLVFTLGCGGGGGAAAPTAANPGDTGAPAPGATQNNAAGSIACTDGAHTGAQVISFTGTHGASPTDVTIKAGDWVTWTNNSQTNHQIEFPDSGTKCGFLLVGKSVSVQFNSAGTFRWNCLIHPSFELGKITVS